MGAILTITTRNEEEEREREKESEWRRLYGSNFNLARNLIHLLKRQSNRPMVSRYWHRKSSSLNLLFLRLLLTEQWSYSSTTTNVRQLFPLILKQRRRKRRNDWNENVFVSVRFFSFFLSQLTLLLLTTCQTLTYFTWSFQNFVVSKRRAYERDLGEREKRRKRKDTTTVFFQAHNGVERQASAHTRKRERERKEKSETYFFLFLLLFFSSFCY